MCGRFTTAGVDRLRTAFPNFRFPEGVAPRYNIAPTDPVVAAVNDGSAEACWLRWGLVPAWSSGPGGRPAINARIETIAEKQSWRRPLSERRCAIFADGFYEWHRSVDNGTVPYYLRLKSGEPFAFAGLWDRWRPRVGEPIESCTIITAPPNELVSELHDRMPVILRPEAIAAWLDPALRDPGEALALLEQTPSDVMEAFPVSHRVNSVRNDDAGLIDPAA